MKLRICSDIHTEFMNAHAAKLERILAIALHYMPDDAEQTLVIAGDFGSMHKPKLLVNGLEILCKRFKEVIYIPGNHEYYGGSLERSEDAIKSFTRDIPNLQFGSQLNLGKIKAATLWTDFDGQNKGSIELARLYMNDYRQCLGRKGLLLAPEDTITEHIKELAFLSENIREGDVVITHHLPSFKSVDPEFTYSRLNGAYATNLENLIMEKKPAVWVHGHTHAPQDYMIGQTRIICNPRGYAGQEGNGYNPNLVIEV